MKNQVKKFGQYIKESDDFGFDAPMSRGRASMGRSSSPQEGDEVFVTGFADDGGVVINAFAGYGTIVEVNANGSYLVELESMYDISGISDNAPEAVRFKSSDIVHGGNGEPWAVVKMGMQY